MFFLFRMNLRSSIEQSLLYWSARKVSGEIDDEVPAVAGRRFPSGLPRLAWTTGGSLAIVATMLGGAQYVKYEAMPYLLERDAVETIKAFNLSGVRRTRVVRSRRTECGLGDFTPEVGEVFAQRRDVSSRSSLAPSDLR